MADPLVSALQLEHELEEARRHGRWLADDERAALAEQQLRRADALERQRRHRQKLTILALVCVVIPPLWPVALGLILYLLFPQTTLRLGLAAGVGVLALGLLGVGLVAAVLIAIVMALF
jgi:hypothetical protein